MGRSSNKQPRFQGGGGDDLPAQDDSFKHSAEYEQKQIELLLNQKPRMSWEEYKERHKEQLEDRMGAGIEKEQADYRRMLDAERNAKLSRGHNNKHLAESEDDKSKKKKKKEGKDKDKKDKKDKKRKDKKEKKKRKDKKKDKRKSDSRTTSGSSGSSSSDGSSESDSDEGRRKRARKDDGAGKMTTVHEEEVEGPVRLSDFHSGKYDRD